MFTLVKRFYENPKPQLRGKEQPNLFKFKNYFYEKDFSYRQTFISMLRT